MVRPFPRRLLGRELRKAREKANVSVEYARAELSVSKQTFWRMENGLAIKINPLFVKRLCEIYGVPDGTTQVLLSLTEEMKAKGWWHTFDGAIPPTFGLFVGMEDAAHRVVSYQTTFMPGLLQTDDYRRAMFWAEFPNTPSDEVETTVAIAAKRRTRLVGDVHTLTLDSFIDESALRRPTGSAAVMVDQLRHIAEFSRLPNVSVRVLPTSAGMYKGLLVGSFVLLEFPPHPTAYLTEPPIVYIEGHAGDLYLEQHEEVATYRGVCTDLERLALDDAESHKLILRITEEFNT